MKVFDAKLAYEYTYSKHELDEIVKNDKFFSGKNHHWALRFHKCLPQDIMNDGLLCDNAWLKNVEPEEVRTEAGNIEDLDRGTFKW